MTRIVINGITYDVPGAYPHVGKAAGPTPGKVGNSWKAGSKWIPGYDNSASGPLAPIIPVAPSNSAVPTIEGTAQVGVTLNGTFGVWAGTNLHFVFQWLANDAAIPGAIGGDYTLVAGDVGKIIKFRLIGNNALGTATATSVGTSVVIAAAAPSAPVLSISSAISLNEGNSGTTNFTYIVTRTGNLSAASSANWAVTGTPNAADFVGNVLPSGTINFPINSVTQNIVIPVAGDVTAEADENFAITLSSLVNSTIANNVRTGTILNDDGVVAGTIGPPVDVVLTSVATAYPPTLAATFLPQHHMVDDILRVAVYPAVAMSGGNIVPSGTAVLDTTVTLVGVAATNIANINAALTGRTSGIGFVFLRAERGAIIGTWAVPAQYGTSAVPAIVSSLVFTTYELAPFQHTIQLASPVRKILLRGQDQEAFELALAKPGINFLMQFAGNVPRTFPARDFNTDNHFDVIAEITGLNGVITTTTYDVTLAAVSATQFNFADVSNVPLDAYGQSPTVITVAGLPAGVSTPVTTDGQISKDNGVTWYQTLNVFNDDLLLARVDTPNVAVKTKSTLSYGNKTDSFFAIGAGYVAPITANWVQSSEGAPGLLTVSEEGKLVTVTTGTAPVGINGDTVRSSGDHIIEYEVIRPAGTAVSVGFIDTVSGSRIIWGGDGGVDIYNSVGTLIGGGGIDLPFGDGHFVKIRANHTTGKFSFYKNNVLGPIEINFVASLVNLRPRCEIGYGTGSGVRMNGAPLIIPSPSLAWG